MNGLARRAILCLALLGGVSSDVCAQTPWRLWGAVGGGMTPGAVAATGELVFQKGAHQITARAVVMGDPYGAESGQNPMGEIGLLYGRTAMSRRGHLSMSAGLAVTDTDMDSEEGMTLGVPLVGEAAFSVLPVLGLGLQGFANLNSNDSYGGFALFLQLGYLPGEH